MNKAQWFAAKLYAGRVLARMLIWLVNWRDIWSSYRAGLPLPPLNFRRGFTLHHGSGDDPVMLLHEVFAGGCYRRHIRSPSDGVMIDLGANIGAVTLDWASRSQGLHIHAYEPNPKTNKVLRNNIRVNGLENRVTVHSDAVGRVPGDLKLWTNVHSMLATGYGDFPPAPDAIHVKVPMVDLNEVIKRANGELISLLKIDTEGAEADILEGATPHALKTVEQVILEYHNHLCLDALSRCKMALDQAGFRCRVRPLSESQGLLYAWRESI